MFDGPKGAFAILDLPPDLYQFRFEAEGYFPQTLEDVPVRKGTARRGLRVRLRRAATVLGAVVGERSGAPVTKAVVEALDGEVGSRLQDLEGKQEVLTDPDGRFRIATRPGSLRLRVTHARLAPWAGEPFEVPPGESQGPVTVTLRPGGGVDGFVLGPDRSPASRALVVAYREDEGSPSSKQSQADERGYFRILGLAAGRYRVHAYPRLPPGPDSPARRPRASVAVEDGRVARVELPEPRGGGCLVRGRVSRKGEPVAGAHVTLLPAPSGPQAVENAFEILDRLNKVTGTDGSFAFEGVPPGGARLTVQLLPPGKKQGGLYAKTFPLLVPDAPELAFDAHLPPGEITGRIFRDSNGSPVVGAPVSAFQLDSATAHDSSESSFCETDARGRYRIVDLRPGEYYVRTDPHLQGRSRDPIGDPPAALIVGPVSVGDSAVPLDFALPEGGSVVVRLRDPSGRPVLRATVSLRHADVPRAARRAFDEWTEAEPGEEGVFRADGLRPGLYSGSVAARGYALAFEDGWRVGEGEESAFEVDLPEGTRVVVRALDGAGSPVDLALVDVADSRGRSFRHYRGAVEPIRSGEKGAVVVFLGPGEYELTGGAGGGRGTPTRVAVEAGSPREVVVPVEREEGRR
ncbi:MAG TPA: carboxypeptidase-like regulatory domain-containing protein [Planctomycetota bacterium]|nr:carboxypeptidase-like regulatory domain-containing protein [Planctomycetota bacterium]